MKYAENISGIINAFSPDPLDIEQLDKFYYDNTMECRTGDEYTLPMEDIFDDCIDNEQSTNTFLLLGHRGCGKSTELNKLSKKFKSEGYYVKTINCSIDLDLLNIVHSDLFILMGEALLEIANECNCKINKDIQKHIEDFWIEGTKISTRTNENSREIDAGLSTTTPFLFTKLFANIKTDLKFNTETREEYREKINRRTSEWIKLLNDVAEEITKTTDSKKPIIIFEDLDKLNPENAWKVFYHFAATLSSMSFPVIYTFPIALSYDPKFSTMEIYFKVETLPMIKIEKIDGNPFEDGINVIKRIVEKRANLDLFEVDVLEYFIKYTGGSLRDLFHVINTSAKRAKRRQSATISIEDAKRALEELKTSLTRRIEEEDYDFLIEIYNGKKEKIENKEKLLKMLQASVVLEYNGKRWHNVHPLVTEFLKNQGLIE